MYSQLLAGDLLGHYLTDKFLLVFQSLPHVCAPSLLGDVAVNVDFRIGIPLPEALPFLLLHITGMSRDDIPFTGKAGRTIEKH